MKATEQYFGALLSIKLYTLFLIFESLDHKNLQGVHSNESDFSNNFPEVFVIVLYKEVATFESVVLPLKWKPLSSTFPWCCLSRCTRWF